MAASSPLPTILTLATAAIVVAVVASFLPVNQENSKIKAVGDLQFTYKEINESTVKPGEENIFDFLKFNLSPTVMVQANKKITRAKPSQTTQTQTKFARSSEKFVTVSENLVAIAQNDKQAALDELVAHKSALQSNNPNDCTAIENKYSAQNCRDEIYFQKAVAAKNNSLCTEIINDELKSRCQSYLDLTLQHEVAR